MRLHVLVVVREAHEGSIICDANEEGTGDVGGFGLVDDDDARDLIAAAAGHPPHSLVRHRGEPRRHRRRARMPARPSPAARRRPARFRPPQFRVGQYRAVDHRTVGILSTLLIPITRGPCDHAHGEVGYHPTRALVHLIRARNARCTAPGCGRPCAVTWTTPSRGTRAAGPVSATWLRRAHDNDTHCTWSLERADWYEDENNDGVFPDESPVEGRYHRSKQEEQGDRE
jgi:hypothetical protein